MTDRTIPAGRATAALATATLGLLTALAIPAQAQAQTQAGPQAGAIVVRLGGTEITPQVKSGNLSAPSLPGTQIDVGSANQVSGGIAYAVTRNFWIDLPIGLPFEHDIRAAGAIAGAGKLAQTKALPVTLVAQWRFEPVAGIRPFVGAAAVHARFNDTEGTPVLTALTGGTPARPTSLSLKNATGPGLQLGLAFPVTERVGFELSLMKVWLKTTGTLSTGQRIDVRLDPIAASAALSWRF